MGFLILVREVDPFVDFSAVGVLVRFLKGIASWLWVVAIMGLVGSVSRRRTDEKKPQVDPQSAHGRATLVDRVAEYAQDARLPFYIMHQTVIVLIAFYVVQWDTGALLKYLVICLSAIVVTLLLYDIGVRRTRLTRFLFGLRPRRRAPDRPAREGGVLSD